MNEFELIEQLRAVLPGQGPRVRVGSGDDAAVTEPLGATATSVDAMVEGIHFTLPEFSPEAVGHKALAGALSDLAAMGAEAGEAYVVLGLPSSGDEEELCLGIAEGIARLARNTGTSVIGGDITRSPVLTVTVTAVGHEPRDSWLVTRAGARPGDIVAVTGELGGAAAALKLLDGTAAGEPAAPAALRARQFAPEPRLGAGRALADARATAMIDISDGLGADAGHLAEAGGVRLEIQMGSVPLQPGVAEVAGTDEAAFELAASGGEDFELLACLPPQAFDAAVAAVEKTGVALTGIGIVGAGSGVALRTPGGAVIEAAGFDHLA
ncbi:MAG: thiamine-monophosphate kinase [Solirubrobacterales bacterium]|nr:thiamine-monophosphate kinase [Solirubrobacterales bacterium]